MNPLRATHTHTHPRTGTQTDTHRHRHTYRKTHGHKHAHTHTLGHKHTQTSLCNVATIFIQKLLYKEGLNTNRKWAQTISGYAQFSFYDIKRTRRCDKMGISYMKVLFRKLSFYFRGYEIFLQIRGDETFSEQSLYLRGYGIRVSTHLSGLVVTKVTSGFSSSMH